jgi:hypothetical protein
VEWDFVPSRPRLPEGAPLRALLGGSGDFDGLFGDCPDSAFREQMRALAGGDADRVLNRSLLAHLDGAQVVKLALLAARKRPGRGLVIAAAAWRQLTTSDAMPWLNSLRDRIVAFHHGKDVAGPGTFGERVVVIGSRAGQIAVATCPWLQKRAQQMLNRICAVSREYRVGFELDAVADDGADAGDLAAGT